MSKQKKTVTETERTLKIKVERNITSVGLKAKAWTISCQHNFDLSLTFFCKSQSEIETPFRLFCWSDKYHWEQLKIMKDFKDLFCLNLSEIHIHDQLAS